MKKIFVFIFISVFFLTVVGPAYAPPGDAGNWMGTAAGTYIVTINKIEISQDNSNWVTLGEGAMAFNIASMTAGQDFSNYVSGAAIPAGTYQYVRVTISRTIQIRGTGTNAGSTYYTTAATVSMDGGSLGVSSAADDDTNYATSTIVIPAAAESPSAGETLTVSDNNLTATRALPNPFTVPETGGTLSITFGTQNTLEFDPDDSPGNIIFWPVPPDMTMSFEGN